MSPTLEQVNPPMHVAVRWVKELLPVNNLSFNSTHYGTFWDEANKLVFDVVIPEE